MTRNILNTIASWTGMGKVRLLAFAALFLFLSIAGPWYIFSRFEIQSVNLDARLFSVRFLAPCLGLLFIYYGCDCLRLHYTLRALGRQVSKRYLARLVFINIFFSNITPMATGGGFAQIFYLRRLGVPLGTATAATTLRTLLAVGFIFLPAPFLFLGLEPLRANELGQRLTFYLALFALGYLVFFAVVLFRTRWMVQTVIFFLHLLHRYRIIRRSRLRRWQRKAMRELVRFSYGMRTFLRGPLHYVLLSILFTGLFLLALFSFPALILMGLHQPMEYLLSVGLSLVATFIMYFSPTPGAAGIAEGIFGLFFFRLVDSGDLVLVTILWRFLTIHLGMLVGLPLSLWGLMGMTDNE